MADAIERARAIECLAQEYEATAPAGKYAANDIRNGILGPENERTIRAMLAFAQQAPEGWEPIEKFEGEPGKWDVWSVYLDDFGKPTGTLHQSAKFVLPETFVNGGWYDFGGNPLEWQSDQIEEGCPNAPSRHVTHFRPLPAPPAMLDASPSVGEVG